jgi:2-dehydro-3-deoxygalactonokinase
MSVNRETWLIALDWGTTALRAYRFDRDGRVAEARQLASGVLHITDGDTGFARALDAACGDWRRNAPRCAILASGMVGSAQGWREAPYLEIPIDLDELGRSLTPVDAGDGAVLHIVPGLIARGALPDVLRGEETQVAGALDGRAGALDGRADGWIGLPGTHAKWVRVRDHRIAAFHTFMTGEVYAALCAHTLLGRTMRPPPSSDLAAFDRGVAVARSPEARAGVLSTMFSARTLGLVGALPPEAQADYLSGLLIGHELAGVAELADLSEGTTLVGNTELCQRYQRALLRFGVAAAISTGATERGLWRVAIAAGLVPDAA